MSWWNKNEEEQGIEEEKRVEINVEEFSNPPLKEKQSPVDTTSGKDMYEKRYGTVRSALGEGTVIQGKLSFDTPVRIDGNLSGEVFSSSTLIVGDAGKVSASVNVDTLVVLGSVSGDITARKRLEIHASGEVVGDITSPSVFIEEGAYFEGSCKMESSAVEEAVKNNAVKGQLATPEKASSQKVPIVQRSKDAEQKESPKKEEKPVSLKNGSSKKEEVEEKAPKSGAVESRVH